MVSTIGELAALATAFCWTVSALCWTAAGRRVGSLAVNIIRLFVALPMFLLYNGLVLGEVVPLSASSHAWVWLSLSGVAGFFLCDLFFFSSFLLIGPRMALLIFSLAPPLSALFGWILLGEHLTRWNWIGMAITLSGILWVILQSPDRREDDAQGQRGKRGRGVLHALLAAVAQGLATVLCKVGMRDMTSPVAGTEIRLISGLACFLVLIPLLGRQGQVVRALRDGRAMAIMTLGAFIGPFVGVSLLLFAVKLIPAGLAQTFVSLSPVMIIPASALVFKERISARAVGGAALAVLGAAILFL